MRNEGLKEGRAKRTTLEGRLKWNEQGVYKEASLGRFVPPSLTSQTLQNSKLNLEDW
jgi:hypothetical protein